VDRGGRHQLLFAHQKKRTRIGRIMRKVSSSFRQCANLLGRERKEHQILSSSPRENPFYMSSSMTQKRKKEMEKGSCLFKKKEDWCFDRSE